MEDRKDVIIVGSGPAGLEAAVTLKIRGKDFLIFGNGVSTKVEKAESIRNYLALPEISGKELKKRFEEHLARMEIGLTREQVTGVYSMGGYFNVQASSGQIYEAKSVILASGVDFGKPYPGEEKFLGRGVSYCATCDALLYKKKTVAVIGGNADAAAEAEFLSTVAGKVYYIPLNGGGGGPSGDIEVVRDVPVSIGGSAAAEKLVLKERTLEVDGVFILRDSILPASLAPGIRLDGNHIEVNRRMETNLKGCFACGDITGAPYQYIKAAGEGNIAALSAVQYLER